MRVANFDMFWNRSSTEGDYVVDYGVVLVRQHHSVDKYGLRNHRLMPPTIGAGHNK